MINKLPTFKGYTVDVRLKEFRKTSLADGSLEFIPFSSIKGEELLSEFVSSLDSNSKGDLQILSALW